MRPGPCFVSLVLMLGACGWKTETRYAHYVHRGEKATLWTADSAPVLLALDKTTSREVEAALGRNDRAAVDALVSAGKAFPAPAGTAVVVVSESFNERQVKVTEGPLTGKTGWCPVERLRPPQRGEL